MCGPGKHNCQPFCGPEGRFYCSDSVCSLRPAPFSYLCVRVRILGVLRKLSAAEQIKPDCCRTPAVVSILLTPLPGSLSCSTLHCTIRTWRCESRMSGATRDHSRFQRPRPRPQQTTQLMTASHQHHRRRSTTDDPG